MNKRYCPLRALRIFVYQLVVLRIIRQKYFVFEGSGGKSRDWQGECEIVQTVENRNSSQRHGNTERRRVWWQGKRRTSSKTVIPPFLLLLKTHGHKSPCGLSKCLPRSLTKAAGKEMHVWGNALVHGSSKRKQWWGCKETDVLVPLMAQNCLTMSKTQTGPLHHFILLPLSLFVCVCVFWLDILKVRSHGAWGLQP